MTATVHVETCPTCHGDESSYIGTGSPLGPCRACRVVPGYLVPEWVVVPMAAHGGSHKGATGWFAPDPAWQPGASVTLTADCRDCHPDNWTGDRNVIDHLHEHGALREAVEAMDGEACCTNGEVPVGSAVIADLVPVIAVPDTGYPDGAPDLFAYVSKAGALRIVDRIAKTDTFIAYKVVRAPGATLARLETP